MKESQLVLEMNDLKFQLEQQHQKVIADQKYELKILEETQTISRKQFKDQITLDDEQLQAKCDLEFETLKQRHQKK